MSEKLFAFAFGGILGALIYHFALGAVAAHFSTAAIFLQYWYVPHILLPAAGLIVLAWALGFFRLHSSRLGDLGVLVLGAGIIVCTIGAPYNCWNEICF